MGDKQEHYRHHGKQSTLKRWEKACRCAPFAALRGLVLIEHFLKALRYPQAGASTNVELRILHNHALDMRWLLTPVLLKNPRILKKTALP